MVHERLKRLEGVVTSIIRQPDLEALEYLQGNGDLLDETVTIDCTTLTNHCICTVNFEYLHKPEHLIKCLRKGKCFHCQRYQHMHREYETITASTRLLLLAAAMGKFEVFKYLHERGSSLESKTGVHELRPLHLSIIHGHFNIFCYLLAHQVDINAIMKSNGTTYSPLMQAVLYNRKDMIRHLLMVKGLDLSFRNSLSQSPILFAVQQDNLDLIDLLLGAEEAFLNQRYGRTSSRFQKLQHPCAVLEAIKHDNPAILKTLLENGCEPDYIFNGYHNFTTAAILASIKNSHRCLKVLVANGADIETQIDGYSPPDWANHFKWTKCISVLNEGNRTSKITHDVVGSEINEAIRPLQSNQLNSSSEGHAISFGEEDRHISKFDNSNVCVNEANPIIAIWNLAQWLNIDDEIKRLAHLGHDINSQDVHGRTSLHLAVEEQHVSGVRALIQCGADTEIRDKCGATPLWHAVFWNKESMIKELITANVKLECKANENAYKLGHTSNDCIPVHNDGPLISNKTPLRIAVEKNFHETTALLIEAGYDTSGDNLDDLIEVAKADSKLVLESHLNTPKTLFAVSRNCLRRFYGRKIHLIANQYYLPTRIAESLLLKDVLECAYSR